MYEWPPITPGYPTRSQARRRQSDERGWSRVGRGSKTTVDNIATFSRAGTEPDRAEVYPSRAPEICEYWRPADSRVAEVFPFFRSRWPGGTVGRSPILGRGAQACQRGPVPIQRSSTPSAGSRQSHRVLSDGSFHSRNRPSDLFRSRALPQRASNRREYGFFAAAHDPVTAHDIFSVDPCALLRNAEEVAKNSEANASLWPIPLGQENFGKAVLQRDK